MFPFLSRAMSVICSLLAPIGHLKSAMAVTFSFAATAASFAAAIASSPLLFSILRVCSPFLGANSTPSAAPAAGRCTETSRPAPAPVTKDRS